VSVVETVARVSPDVPLLAWGRGAPTMGAGSTWLPDEAVVLEAFAAVRRRHPDARLVLVPHEPTPRHLDRVAAAAARLDLPAPVRLSQADAPGPFLLVDRVGVLARLYGGGRMAYVGGGFGRAGLHSVLEPAAWGLPVVFGPWWSNSREAGLLLEAGAAVSLPPRSHGAGRALTQTWNKWCDDEAEGRMAGRKALDVVRAGTGAADRNARLVEQLVLTTDWRRLAAPRR
ncbi:MAG: Three-deoxy-D-manno-octulosonic-acid transferase protein, partial [Gemmatimonadetes bacterium]|nr:Three-deoxy-D-manno-octulosonic-acid transferase protein [Gemmatimonadota bacterium]